LKTTLEPAAIWLSARRRHLDGFGEVVRVVDPEDDVRVCLVGSCAEPVDPSCHAVEPVSADRADHGLPAPACGHQGREVAGHVGGLLRLEDDSVDVLRVPFRWSSGLGVDDEELELGKTARDGIDRPGVVERRDDQVVVLPPERPEHGSRPLGRADVLDPAANRKLSLGAQETDEGHPVQRVRRRDAAGIRHEADPRLGRAGRVHAGGDERRGHQGRSDQQQPPHCPRR
jgi:hypothetical protein